MLSDSNNNNLKSLRQNKFSSTKKDYDTIYSKLSYLINLYRNIFSLIIIYIIFILNNIIKKAVIKVVNLPTGIKGVKMDINAIKYIIQEIYSLKFLKDTQALLSQEESEPEPFPTFVW